MKLNILANKQEVAIAFSEYLKEKIETSESDIHVALSGGSTPKAIFDYMAENYAKSIQWNKLHLYWGDERCVLPTDAESNYKMTVDHLLSKIDFPEANIHRVKGENTPADEAIAYGEVLDENLEKVNDIPQFDVVILGMGDDGHTASIFPHEIDLWQSNNNCEVAIHPESGQKRITITGKVINNAKEVAFLVTGAGKAPKVKEIIKKEGDYTSYPATLVAPTSEKLLWLLDEAAAIHIK